MKLWGGRFAQNTNALLEKFNASIGFDQKMFREDIEGSIAHSKMLNRIGVLTEREMYQICEGLYGILSDMEQDKVTFTNENEDIHMSVEALLVERIGDVGKKLHTGRSRNDQVAVDFRLYVMRKAQGIADRLLDLMAQLLETSKDNVETIMPGYTHLQRAQPIRLAFHLMAYFQMLKRDHSRIQDLIERMDVMPLGSGALAGVNYETDREYLMEQLGFKHISENAMDAVSDRDFAIEFNSAAAIIMMHLSRMAEEWVIWSSSEFKFIEIGDAFTTGSSIMPQKKNPDAAELVRGKTGRVYGNLMGLLTVMKSLPLAYNKDMQEDKEGVFDSIETVEMCLDVTTEMLKVTAFLKDNMRSAVNKGFLNATDMADYLVHKGVPFRTSHEVVGKLVKYCVEMDTMLEALPLEELKTFDSHFDESVYEWIDIEHVIEQKKSYGSTAKASVLASIKNGYAFLDEMAKK